jgi:hypothetical protein
MGAREGPIFTEVRFADIVKPPYSSGAVERTDFPGFREDYLVLHALIRRYRPRRLAEVGTSYGSGTNVICRAMNVRRGVRLFRRRRTERVLSIDVLPGTDPAVIYPDGEDGHPKRAGQNCRYPYTQLFGDSTTYDFEPFYPIDAWFIDGKHSFEYVAKDTQQALRADPKLIIWHDMQIDGVASAVADVMSLRPYDVRLVRGTRVAFAVRRSA